MTRTAAIALAAALASCEAWSSEQPSFDCAEAASDVLELICSDAELAKADRDLAQVYSAARATVERLDAGRAEASAELRAEQRGWIKGRDDCWKAEDMRACVAGSYHERIATLTAAWMLSEPIATVEFVCEGNPANTFTAMFFGGPALAARVERGDGVAAGWQIPSASGARYALPFGDELWAKGDGATLIWRQGAPLSCKARL